jgi:cytochrome P450
MSKDKEVYYDPRSGVANIIGTWSRTFQKILRSVSNDADHSRMRRLLSHAFSDAALRDQEQLITHYFDLLIEKLQQQVVGPEQGKVDLVRWYNFTTFDILGDICFDESFGALKKGQYHSWIASLFQSLKIVRMFSVFRAYPILGKIVFSLLKLFPQVTKAGAEHQALTAQKAERRLDRQTDRKDIMRYAITV